MSKPFSNISRSLLKKPLAFAGLCFIALCILVSIFAYQLAPDNSPNGDLQTVEIQAKPPGFSQQFLLTSSNIPKRSGVSTFFTGIPSTFTYIPVLGFTIEKNGISVRRYIDEDTSNFQFFESRKLAFPHDPRKNIVTRRFWLGTDTFGRDILSRLIIGVRISLAVGLIATIVSILIGVVLGAIAGYYRGRADSLIMWVINVTWSIPTLLLVFAITMAAGKGFWQIFIAVGLTLWVSVARVVRGEVRVIRELEYIQAARSIGLRDGRIIFRHILPNITGPLLVLGASNFATAIIIEAGLSFLGIGVQAPQPSWGLMIRENYTFIVTHDPLQAMIPGIAIMLLVLSFNVLGNALRDILDVTVTT